MDSDPAFLASLEDGDQVILKCYGNYRSKTRQDIAKVRTTRTQVIANGVRFRKSDGHTIGEGLHSYRLLPYTEDAALAIRRERLNDAILQMMKTVLPEEIAQLSNEETVRLEEALCRAGLSKGRFTD